MRRAACQRLVECGARVFNLFAKALDLGTQGFTKAIRDHARECSARRARQQSRSNQSPKRNTEFKVSHGVLSSLLFASRTWETPSVRSNATEAYAYDGVCQQVMFVDGTDKFRLSSIT